MAAAMMIVPLLPALRARREAVALDQE
jgi:hypothetical protein